MSAVENSPEVEQELDLRPYSEADRLADIEAYVQACKQEGLLIDPGTAEVMWTYAETLDPYGLDDDLPEELSQIGREYFARRPGGDIWVHFHDLPESTENALWKKHKSKLAFPAGLFNND